MMAVIKLAVPQIRCKFRESALQHAFSQMVEAEFLEARRIDNRCFLIDHIQAREGGGVLAGIECGGNFTHGNVGIRHDQVDDR
ncbi:hypothetical protein D3C81_2095160 [compost metagenome]